MRKAQKKQIEKLLELLSQLHEEIRTAIKVQKNKTAMELLEQCQQNAIELGSIIECLETEGLKAIGMLENYCELVFQIYEKIGQGQLVDANKTYKALRKQLIQIENTTRRDLKVIWEVVFLPYKAAMWDSMETIWKAMNEDERYHVDVIPIPYYDKNPDGSFREEHNEGAAYPEYVPITEYGQYDFTERQPDVIFIHNPFDDCNYVTSVHPFFFSSNLKQYTQCLVYVPYFISGGYISDTHYALNSYLYIDKILTQSESMKKYFHPAFHNKLLPLGSPKADRILSADYVETLPDEWKEKINGKKVFLYNTSITGLLKDNEQLLKKIQYIFECFEEKKEAVLLWRPHPLMESTIHSMRPHLLQEYKRLIGETKRLSNVIYDSNPNVSLSAKISDAYIGESTSSMVCLLGIQGKPIFLTNTNITVDYTKDKASLPCYDCISIHNEYWLSGGKESYLYHINKDKVLERLLIPNETIDGNRLYNEIIPHRNQLILVPYFAKEIAIYNMENKSFMKIPFKDGKRTRFVHGIKFGEKILMVPAYGDAILELDLEKNKLLYHTDCITEIKKTSSENQPLFFNTVVRKENLIVAAAAQTNKVLIFHMDSKEYEYRIVGNDTDGYWSMVYSDGNFWLASNNGCFLTKWNYEKNTWKKIELFPNGFAGENKCFIQLVEAEDHIYIFSKNSNMLLKLNTKTEEITEWDIHTHYKEGSRKNDYYNWPSNYYFARKISNHQIVTMSAYDNSILTIDIESGIIQVDDIEARFDQKDFYKKFRRQSKNIPLACSENNLTTLCQFIDVASGDFDRKDVEIGLYKEVINHMDGTCGEKVKNYLAGIL